VAKINLWFCYFLVSAVVISQANAAQSVNDRDRGSNEAVTTGKTVFNSAGCWSCHGFSGQGGLGTGPHIARPDMLPKAAFFRQLRRPINAMPPYSAVVLSDSQIDDVYEYLRSLPESPKANDIPLLKLN
jgi:ubiquinol-cytochrome c reductase cytochrome c subunit